MAKKDKYWGSASTPLKCKECGTEKDVALSKGVPLCIDCEFKKEFKDGTPTVGTYSFKSAVKKCGGHNLTPFKFSKTDVLGKVEATLYLSANRDRSKDPKIKPTAACYLDIAWVKGMVFAGDRGTGNKVMFVAWPDFGVVSMRVLRQAVKWIDYKVQGGERVELGCIGGHGRTGTMTACYMVYKGWAAKDAIKEIRKSYCSHAIEGEKQENLIKEFQTWLHSR